ncbi:APC family permease [Algoriphagus sp. AK58]|uniref:APC family permease n=1 Tax=Algoriphagus sp. AK58 TaxID=1406877 RepID=UPI0016506136|nr:amino acid permease [Algoriphagus sp. AK58]MBC6367963.1 amino acid permease [Algoriphagus sp. AK58]
MKNSSSRQLGLITVISLVAGGMIGSGIFALPAALARFGGISLIGWMVAALGALTLAQIMGKLSKAIPENGGSYIYTKRAFGDFPSFLVAWGYWMTLWTTNAAIGLTFAGYLSVFFPVIEHPWLSVLVALGVLWSLSLLNTYSVRASGNLQVVTTLLKIIPVLVVAIGGIFFFNPDHFFPFNLSGESSLQAISGATVLCFFAFLGIETATIPADNIKNPEKNISKGTMIGVILVILLYIFSTISLFGAISPGELAHSIAPLSDTATRIFGGKARYWVAAGACISTFGALNVWILVQGQISRSLALDGYLPKSISQLNRKGSPGMGIAVSSSVASILLLANSSKGFADLYEFMVELTTLTSLLFYLSAASAFAYFAFTRQLGFQRNFREIGLGILGMIFSFWIIFGSGLEIVIWCVLGVLLGVPFYFWKKYKMGKLNDLKI